MQERYARLFWSVYSVLFLFKIIIKKVSRSEECHFCSALGKIHLFPFFWAHCIATIYILWPFLWFFVNHKELCYLCLSICTLLTLTLCVNNPHSVTASVGPRHKKLPVTNLFHFSTILDNRALYRKLNWIKIDQFYCNGVKIGRGFWLRDIFTHLFLLVLLLSRKQ